MSNLSTEESQIHQVSNFNELVTSSFQGRINALCLKRKLIGDFSEIVRKIELKENMSEIAPKDLIELQLSQQGQLAREIILNDFKRLSANKLAPTLNLIKCYERDDSYPFFPTDVYSFHVDRSPVPTATFLCTYHGEASEILPNSYAQQKILLPEIRKELKTLYDGHEEGFGSFLREYFFDLHYQAKAEAKLINLGIGHIWKLAVDHPESEVLPCVHRAPLEKDGEPRLLMIC